MILEEGKTNTLPHCISSDKEINNLPKDIRDVITGSRLGYKELFYMRRKSKVVRVDIWPDIIDFAIACTISMMRKLGFTEEYISRWVNKYYVQDGETGHGYLWRKRRLKEIILRHML